MGQKTLKIFYTFLLACFVSPIQSQISSSSTITSTERKKLETRFKKLETFRIDEDGTVVYLYEKKEPPHTQDTVAVEYVKLKPKRVKIKIGVDDTGNYTVTDKSKEESEQTTPQTKSTPENKKPQADSIQAQTRSKEVPKQPTKSQKEQVFKKKEPSYGSLEEAALAVEMMLDEFKREENQLKGNGKGSLSKKASRGVDGSLKTNSLQDFTDNDDEVVTPQEAEKVTYNGDPDFFINGVKSTRAEFEKIKSNNILRKERKRSLTNPNGEWRLETK